MKIKTVAFKYGRKVNLGDFQSADIECNAWADLDEGENPQEAMNELAKFVKQNVRESYIPLAKTKSNIMEVEMREYAESLKQDIAKLEEEIARRIDGIKSVGN